MSEDDEKRDTQSEQHRRMLEWIRRYYASDVGADWDNAGQAILDEIDAAKEGG